MTASSPNLTPAEQVEDLQNLAHHHLVLREGEVFNFI